MLHPAQGKPRPYRRTCRQFLDGGYAESGRSQYITHPRFAQSPEHYVRAFLMIQRDLLELFDYVEPADSNERCYSYRIHALLQRACIEIEANWKAIFTENGFGLARNVGIRDYWKIECSHRLSRFIVTLPNWTGERASRQPFQSWATSHDLAWYSAHNASKHDRQNQFSEANFGHLIDACCGLVALLSAQFWTYDFTKGPDFLIGEGPPGVEVGIGGYFQIGFPTDWPSNERYNFNWFDLHEEPDPFQNFNYATCNPSSIPVR